MRILMRINRIARVQVETMKLTIRCLYCRKPPDDILHSQSVSVVELSQVVRTVVV